MSNHIRILFFALLTLLGLSSCERDHLYFGSNEMAIVNLTIDWDHCNLNPNGATVYAYNEDGTLYKHFPPFSNPRSGSITLPYGRYKLVVMNDTPEELSETITVSGEENVNTLLASGVPDETKTSKLRTQTRQNDEYCIVSPDTLAVGQYTNLEINEQMLEYFYDRPNNSGLFTYDHEVVIKPDRVTSMAQIKVHVKGLKYAKGTTMSFLRGTSAGYFMGRGEYSIEPVSYGFILNNRMFDEGSSTDGTITASFNVFSLRPSAGDGKMSYFLDINFVLVNGEDYKMSFDVTDQIKVDIDMAVQLKLELNLDIELPEAVDSGDGGGGFHTDLNEWSDIVQEIQM